MNRYLLLRTGEFGERYEVVDQPVFHRDAAAAAAELLVDRGGGIVGVFDRKVDKDWITGEIAIAQMPGCLYLVR